jgi:Na+-driven multidrug efflux pump
VVDLGRVYLIGSAISYPALALTEGCSAVLRGVAHTAPALYLTIISNGGYLLLAAVLVRGTGMGVTGLAVAIVVARYLAAGLAVVLLRRDSVLGDTPVRRPDWSLVGQVGLIGIPFVAEQLFFSGGKLVIQFFIVGMGTLQITANAIAQSVISLSEVLAQAMCIAIVPIVGQAVGAGRPTDARRVIWAFMVSSTLVTVVVGLLMLPRFDWLLGLFHTPAEVTDDVMVIFVLVLLMRPVWAVSFLLPAGLRAAGDTVFTTTVATVAMLVRVALIWLVGVHLGHGVVGVWGVMVSEWMLRGAAFLVRLRGTRWERRSFVTAPAA